MTSFLNKLLTDQKKAKSSVKKKLIPVKWFPRDVFHDNF